MSIKTFWDSNTQKTIKMNRVRNLKLKINFLNKLTGYKKGKWAKLKTKANVDHAGLSQQQDPLKVHMLSRMERILHSQSSSLLTARYLMAIMAAQAGLLSMLLIMLSTLHLKQKVNILIKQLIKNAHHHNSKMMFS
jgi:hypothetical protein